MTVRSLPSTLCCIASAFLPFVALLLFLRLLLRTLCCRRLLALLDLLYAFLRLSPATFVSPPPSCLSFLSCVCFFGYFCGACVAAAFSPLLGLLHAVLRLLLRPFCVAAAFLPFLDLLQRCCGYILPPLCRRRLPAFPLSVVCVFEATSATFVSPPSHPSSIFCMLFCGYFATFVSPPSACLSFLSCVCFFGYFCGACVAAAFSPLLGLLHAVLRLLLRPFCDAAAFSPFLAWSFACCFAATSATFLCRRRLLAFPRSVAAVLRLPSATLVWPPSCLSSICCARFCAHLLGPATFASPLSTSAFPSSRPCPYFDRRVPVHHRFLGSSSALQCCALLTMPSFACWSSSPPWVGRSGRWFRHYWVCVVPGISWPAASLVLWA